MGNTIMGRWVSREPEAGRPIQNKNFANKNIPREEKMKKLIIFISFLYTFHFLPISSLFAEEKTLEEIIVTATRLEEPTGETTSDVRAITEEEIKKTNVDFITDVLRKVPELNLLQNGGVGKVATVLLRGGNSSQTLVMIDGVKVNNPTTGTFDFSGISIDDIERIEILKGPQSTFYGSDAMAGVINIITKKGKGKPRIDASFETGSFGTYNPSITFSGGDKKIDYRLTGSYFYADGISAAKTGTERDGYKNASFSGKFGIRPSEKIELEFISKYYYDRNDLDAFGQDDPNYIQYGNHHLIAGKGRVFIMDNWEQVLLLSRVRDSLKYRDPDTAWNNSKFITGLYTADWQHNFYLSNHYTLTAGIEYRKEKGEDVASSNRSVWNKSFYFNNKLKLFAETLVLNAGLRYDDHETFGSETTYRIGAVYDISPIAMKIKCSYGKGFRAPTLNELYYQDPWGSEGNPDLKPEKSQSWEIGVDKEIMKQRVSMSVIYFNQEYKDLIQWEEIAPWIYSPQNVAKAQIKGIETNVKIRLKDYINIQAGYTYLDTEDESAGQELPLRPKNKVNLSAVFSIGKASVVANYTFVGERFDSALERDLSSYSLVALSGNYNVTNNFMIFGRIDNLFDEDYEETGGYGTPGLSFFGGVRVTL
jgi:vitamin B12 transporter